MESLTRHPKDMGQSSELPACTQCGRTFSSTTRKNEHERNHQTIKHTCDTCGWMFRDYEHFQEHIDGCQTGNKTQDYDGSEHKEVDEEAEPTLESLNGSNSVEEQTSSLRKQQDGKDKRPKIFANASPPVRAVDIQTAEVEGTSKSRSLEGIAVDRNKVKNNDRTYQRSPPDKSFEVHVKNIQSAFSQAVTKSYQCDVCSKKFIHRSNLREHKEFAHRREYISSKAQRDPSLLGDIHDKDGSKAKKAGKLSQTSGNRLGRYCCHTCQRSFKNGQNLASHIVDHQDNKLIYKCTVCTGLFPTWFELYQHFYQTHKIRIQKSEELLYLIKPSEKSSARTEPKKRGRKPKSAMTTTTVKGRLGFNFLPNSNNITDANETFCLPEEVLNPDAKESDQENKEQEKKSKEPKRKRQNETWQISTPPSSPRSPQKTDFCAFCNFEYGDKDDPWLDEPWHECLGCRLFCHRICMGHHRKTCSGHPSDGETTSSSSSTSAASSPGSKESEEKRKNGPRRALYTNERRSSSPEVLVLGRPIAEATSKSTANTAQPSHTITMANSIVSSTPMRTPARASPDPGNKRGRDEPRLSIESPPFDDVIPPLRLLRVPGSTPKSHSFTVSRPPSVSPPKRRRVDSDVVELSLPGCVVNADEHCCYLAVADGFKNLHAHGRLIAKQEVLRVLCNVAYNMSIPSMIIPYLHPAMQTESEEQETEYDSRTDAETFCERELFGHLRTLNPMRRKLAVLMIQQVLYSVQADICFRAGNK